MPAMTIAASARRASVRASRGCRIRLAAMTTPTRAEPVSSAVAFTDRASSSTISIAGVIPPTGPA